MSADSPRRKDGLWIVYCTIFLDLLGFGIILPWLPFYAAELGASGLGLGILFTSYSTAQLVGAAVLGRLSDEVGRRPILMLSLAGSTMGMVASGLATTLPLLCLARATAGLFGGSVSTAQAYVADVTTLEERPKYMGMVGASIGLGFVLGPALGALFISFGQGFREVAFFAAALMAANLVFAFLRLRESRPGDRGSGPVSSRFSLAAWQVAAGRAPLRAVLGATFLTVFAFVGMETTLAFVVRDLFGIDEKQFGLVLTYVGVVMIVVQGGLIGPMSKRIGSRRVAILGCSILALALGALPYAPGLPMLLVVVGGLAVGQGFTSPSLSALASRLATADEQGSVLGVAQSLSAAARATGPVLAGFLYDLNLSLPYWLSAVLVLVAAVCLARGVEPEEG